MDQKAKHGVSFGKREIVKPNNYVKYAIFFDGVRVGVIQGNQGFVLYAPHSQSWSYCASISMQIGGKQMFKEWDTSYYVNTAKNYVRDFFSLLGRV